MQLQQMMDLCAERAAFRIAPVLNSVDVSGRDRDDYRQLFKLKAWEANKEFQKLPAEDKQPSSLPKWTNTVIRNAMFSVGRELVRLPEMARYEFETESQMDYGFEERVGTMDLFQKLQESLSSKDWDLLMVYMANGCNATATWRSEGKPISRRGFIKRVRRVRDRARKIIKGLLKTGSQF